PRSASGAASKNRCRHPQPVEGVTGSMAAEPRSAPRPGSPSRSGGRKPPQERLAAQGTGYECGQTKVAVVKGACAMDGGMRWRLFAGALLLAALLPMPAARASVPVLVIDGKGFGHGVGMAQDGAFWMGMLGSSTNEILGHFYPGTKLSRSGGTVRVAVQDVPNRDTV